jgi:CheY-like chemotaxis protein
MAKPLTILVVDDEPAVRTVLALVLADARFEVVLAADGEEALRRAALAEPAAILLD